MIVRTTVVVGREDVRLFPHTAALRAAHRIDLLVVLVLMLIATST